MEVDDDDDDDYDDDYYYYDDALYIVSVDFAVDIFRR